MLDDDLDSEFPLGDGTAELSAEVCCPYCGETSVIALDPGSGTHQEYVEDCQVCCQPWQVEVHYDGTGAARVSVAPQDGVG
jgi:transposase-like protein